MTVGSFANIALILMALLSVAAWLVWVERRLLAIWQDRLGPNRLGPLGLLQIVADLLKLLSKEDWIPPFADRALFVLAPVITLVAALAAFAVVPVAPGVGIVDLDFGLLYFLALASLSVYSPILGGYASNSKYALYGALRAAAQTLSYELFLGLSLMGAAMLAGSFNLRAIVLAQGEGWFVVPQALGFLLFLIAAVAETRRGPFDLPEAENELAAGFHVEYSGMKFGLFYVGEYVAVLLNSALAVTVFLGGWQGPWLPPVVWFVLKTLALVLLFILVRGALPRPRYDQLMAWGWKLLLPLALLNILVTGGVALWRAGA